MTDMIREIMEQPEALVRCTETNRDALRALVADARKRDIRSIVIAARGTSDHAAVYAKYLFECLTGLPVSLAAPSVLTAYGASMRYESSLVIGVSQSGAAEDVLEVIREAKRRNALSVAITNTVESLLANEADVHLHTNAGLEKSVAATKTFTTQMMLLAELAALWSGNEAFHERLETVPQDVAEALKQHGAIQDSVSRYRYMDECFVLARGVNYAVALETALKIQETNYVRARGYAVSDFHHGPFAMIDRNMPVFLYAARGPALKDMREMVEKLEPTGAEMIVIGNDNDLLAKGRVSFRIPDAADDLLTPFPNIAIAQMLACELAAVKGLNPDKPRGLNKVTVTR